MADEHDFTQIFHLYQRNDVLHVQREVDPGPREMRAVAETGKRGRVHIVARAPQRRRYEAPAPSAMPAAMHE